MGLDWRTIATFEDELHPAQPAGSIDWDDAEDTDAAWAAAQRG